MLRIDIRNSNTTDNIQSIKIEEARALFLGGQGMLGPPRRCSDASSVLELIESLGFVQVDSINVLERAHHLTIHSRLDRYQPELLRSLLEHQRTLFEHWTHDASAIPSKYYMHWKPRFDWFRNALTMNRWWKEKVGENATRTIDEVRRRIENEGPLGASAFRSPNGTQSGWWEWKPHKAALEYLWAAGDLMVTRRSGFQKIYDLTERVLPDRFRLKPPSDDAICEWACTNALERLGIGSSTEIAEYWDLFQIPRVVEWCHRNVSAGRIVKLELEGNSGSRPVTVYAFHDWSKRLESLSAASNQIRLLCPFDPVVRNRQRLKRLFDFDYSFEAYVPEPRRKYGYFVLPILEGMRMVGRLDPKFDRKSRELLIKSIHWEPGIKSTQTRSRKLTRALERLASFLGAERIVINKFEAH